MDIDDIFKCLENMGFNVSDKKILWNNISSTKFGKEEIEHILSCKKLNWNSYKQQKTDFIPWITYDTLYAFMMCSVDDTPEIFLIKTNKMNSLFDVDMKIRRESI